MELRFSCYLVNNLDYPYVARVERWTSPFPIHVLDYEFNKWGETSDISFYRQGREFRFTNESDRLLFVLAWS